MTGLVAPIFDWGQKVCTLVALVNDGSHPGSPEDEVLVEEGEIGEVVRTGMHIEANIPVYIVEFSQGRVVGCLEYELGLADEGANR